MICISIKICVTYFSFIMLIGTKNVIYAMDLISLRLMTVEESQNSFKLMSIEQNIITCTISYSQQ